MSARAVTARPILISYICASACCTHRLVCLEPLDLGMDMGSLALEELGWVRSTVC